jgi:hypothetical protein
MAIAPIMAMLHQQAMQALREVEGYDQAMKNLKV